MKKNKRKNLSIQWSNVYVAVTLIFFLGFGFFLSSKVFLADKLDVLNTEINKEFSLAGNRTFTIKEWIYDEKDNEMQVTLVTSGLTSYLSDLDFKSVSRIDIKKELPTEVKYSSNDIYIVNISEVPKDFKQVALRLVKDEVELEEVFEEEEKNKKDNSIITSIYADENVVKREKISEEKVNGYAIKVTNEMIDSTQQTIKKYQKEMEKNEIIVGKINEEISELKGNLIYQTLDEQTATNNEIYSLGNEIETKETSNEEIKINIESLESRIERLNQRITDLKF